ncbi:MAG: TIGR03986 family type III CRISPR-associated RAMP protein [Isosphaeraceae bacterium]
MAKGTLVVNSKNQVRIKFTNAKGNSVEMAVPDAELIASLRKLKADGNQIRGLDGREVEFDEERGQPKRIRPVGSKWGQEQPSNPPPGGPAPAFHNPYNFVPAPPRETVMGALGDGEPAGHHRYLPDRISGVIRVKLTTETPLLLPDAARGLEDQAGHKSFPVLTDTDGKPILPATSVKGMLRAAYEAVTNSRLSVFQGWDRRLAFRRQAKVEVEPALVTLAKDDQIEIRILSRRWLGSPPKLRRYQQHSPPGDRRKGEAQTALQYTDGSLPAHQDHVWVRVDEKGRVVAIQRLGTTSLGNDWLEGWVLLTGPNINNKKCERVFVVSSDDETREYKGDEAVRLHRLWNELIKDYQIAHKRELARRDKNGEEPSDYLGDTPGRTAWSRHVHDPAAVRLTSGTLCYVRRDNGRIIGLYPVSISRDLFPVSPLSLLPASLRPASSPAELSPADRVFGWVNPSGQGGYRGHMRVGPVCCVTADPIERFPSPGLPLAILGEPKPQQSRFYVAKVPSGAAQPDGFAKEQGYRANKGLRGRKVYPHHRDLPPSYWETATQDRTQQATDGHFQEYRRPRLNNQERRDDQNRSVEGWIKPRTEFRFDLHVTNLSTVELGGLLWLLSLGEGCYHRLGGGKPLGFGSVRLEIDPGKTHLHNGESWKTFYSTLDDAAQTEVDRTGLVDSFKNAVVAAYAANIPGSSAERFERVPFIAAFLRAVKGFEGCLPIHYPRARQPGQNGPIPPHSEGKAYEWFVANERTGHNGGQRVCLPDLASDPGLPMLDR